MKGIHSWDLIYINNINEEIYSKNLGHDIKTGVLVCLNILQGEMS